MVDLVAVTLDDKIRNQSAGIAVHIWFISPQGMYNVY